MELEGKVAVVTGASRGVGLEIARALADRGAAVAGISRSGTGPCHAVAADVTRPEEVAAAKAEIEASLGRPTILVNAAGVFGPISLIKDVEAESWIQTVMVDLVGAFVTCRAFVGGMLEEGWGRIINVTSAASLHPPGPLNSAYGTSKAALNQMTRHLAAELEGTGVTANVIHPGDIKTAMWADIRDQLSDLGPEGDPYRQWVDWVAETGGDPPAKAADLVCRTIAGTDNGRFLWIDQPLQDPIASWDEPATSTQPWR